MSRTTTARLAWSLLAASILLKLAAVVLVQLTPAEHPTPDGLGFLIWAPGVLAFGAVGALIASRRPGNAVGWLFLAIGVIEPIWVATEHYAHLGAVAIPGSLPVPATVGLLGETLDFAVSGTLLLIILLLFPTGRLPSQRWRRILWLVIGSSVLSMVAAVLAPGPLSAELAVENPIGLTGAAGDVVLAAKSVLELSILPLILLTAPALVVRWRGAGQRERDQLKWFVFAVALLSVVVVLVVPLGEILQPVPPAFEGIAGAITVAAVAAIPLSAGIAILRHRLYDIDLLINRTLVYGALTLILGALYVGLVLGIQALVSPFTGNETLAVAISTLMIAGLFGPVRRRVQAVVDRRFYRSRYDARRTVEAFSARLRNEVDLDSLVAELQAATRSTMRPTTASVWLREVRT